MFQLTGFSRFCKLIKGWVLSDWWEGWVRLFRGQLIPGQQKWPWLPGASQQVQSVPRYSPSEPKSPKRTAPRAQLHLGSTHHPQMPRNTHRFFTNRFFTFSPSLPNTWFVSLFVGPVWQWQEQEEQECLCGPGAGSTWSCHSTSLWCPAEGMSRREEQVQICLVQRLWDSTWQHSLRQTPAFTKSWLWPTASSELYQAGLSSWRDVSGIRGTWMETLLV